MAVDEPTKIGTSSAAPPETVTDRAGPSKDSRLFGVDRQSRFRSQAKMTVVESVFANMNIIHECPRGMRLNTYNLRGDSRPCKRQRAHRSNDIATETPPPGIN
jgi:hypothetical protein